MKNPYFRAGQALLITVMLLATVLTVTLAATFKSTTETQLTKLEEESQKALAAAEAAIEKALQQNSSINIGELTGLSGFTGNASFETAIGPIFVTPLVQKDQQYTFYLANYDPINGNLSAPYYTDVLYFYFASEGQGDCNVRNRPALELTLMYEVGSIKKWLIEPCSSGQTISGSNLTTAENLSSNPQSIDGYSFYFRSGPDASNPIQISAITNQPKILIIRSLYASTRIGFSGGSNLLPPQGRLVVSEARSTTGVTKKVKLFQSYPQVPSEFFVTSF